MRTFCIVNLYGLKLDLVGILVYFLFLIIGKHAYNNA